MTQVTVTRIIPSSAEDVWQILRTFSLDYIPRFPHTLTGAGVGAERAFNLPEGEMVERISAFDDPGMRLSYAIVRSPWPVSDYSATIEVETSESGAQVTWSAEFEPSGATEDAAAQIVEGTFKMNLRLLEKMFSA